METDRFTEQLGLTDSLSNETLPQCPLQPRLEWAHIRGWRSAMGARFSTTDIRFELDIPAWMLVALNDLPTHLRRSTRGWRR